MSILYVTLRSWHPCISMLHLRKIKVHSWWSKQLWLGLQWKSWESLKFHEMPEILDDFQLLSSSLPNVPLPWAFPAGPPGPAVRNRHRWGPPKGPLRSVAQRTNPPRFGKLRFLAEAGLSADSSIDFERFFWGCIGCMSTYIYILYIYICIYIYIIYIYVYIYIYICKYIYIYINIICLRIWSGQTAGFHWYHWLSAFQLPLVWIIAA